MLRLKRTRLAFAAMLTFGVTGVIPAQAQTIKMVMSPPAVETNRYWNTPGDFALGPAMQGLVGHDAESGKYDNSGLAESWEHNDDFTEWTFKLHTDAEFHFGYGPVTAADVVGLTTLVAEGYGTITWGFLLVMVLPLLTYGVWQIIRSPEKSDGISV